MSEVRHTLYRVTNDINGKFYIGVHSTKDINDNYLGSGDAICNAIKKYGKENFTKDILGIFPDRETALFFEREIVGDDLIRNDECYNIIIGGKEGVGFGKNNPLYGMTGEDAPFYGGKHTKETRDKISKALKGKMVGENNPCYGLSFPGRNKGEDNPFYGKSHTDEWKENISGKNNPKSTKVKHVKSGKVFDTINEAADHFDFHRMTVSRHCRGVVTNNKFEYVR